MGFDDRQMSVSKHSFLRFSGGTQKKVAPRALMHIFRESTRKADYSDCMGTSRPSSMATAPFRQSRFCFASPSGMHSDAQ